MNKFCIELCVTRLAINVQNNVALRCLTEAILGGVSRGSGPPFSEGMKQNLDKIEILTTTLLIFVILIFNTVTMQVCIFIANIINLLSSEITPETL